MSFDPSTILSGVTHKPLIVCLYGVAGIGKSTWANSAPDAFLLDVNDGVNEIDVNAKTPKLSSYEDFIDALRYCRDGEHDFKTIVIDDIGGVENLIFDKVCRDGGMRAINDFDWGKGHARARERWLRILGALQSCRDEREMHIVLIAHSKVQRFDPPDADPYMRYSVDLSDKTYDMLERLCDAVLFMQYKRVVVLKDRKGNKPGKGRTVLDTATKEAKRVLLTAERAEHRAKNRFSLPLELPVETWSEFEALARKGASKKAKPKPKTVTKRKRKKK